MLKIQKYETGIEVSFGFVVIDRDNQENQYFCRFPHNIYYTDLPADIKNRTINKEAVRVLREKINQALNDLEYAVENQHDDNYLLEIGDPIHGFTPVNNNKW